MKTEALTPALLHRRIVASLPKLRGLLDECDCHWGCEDSVYRFYHQSFKVYALQEMTGRIVDQLQALVPGHPLNAWFLAIIGDGTNRKFTPRVNRRWLVETRPILEAFFHAQYFLEVAVKYGKGRNPPLSGMPSGWATLLYLYGIR